MQAGVSPRLKLVADLAEAEAERLGDYTSAPNISCGAASESGRSPSAKLLTERGITADKIFQALTAVRGSQRVTSQNPRGRTRRRTLRPGPHGPGAQAS